MTLASPRTHLDVPFADLLAADLDDEARDCYRRMAADIDAVASLATGVQQDADYARALLLEALIAQPAVGERYWRALYDAISDLVARCSRLDESGPLGCALERLRAFLDENADIEEGPAA